MRTLKQSHRGENAKGGFCNIQFVAKYQKKGDPLEIFKKFRSLTVPKKIEMGDLLH